VASAPSRADHVEGGVLVSGTNGIVVAAGATDTVVLEGLDIDGIGTGLNGVQITSGLQVYIIRCAIRRFTQNGVNLVSNTSNARAIIRDSFISLNGSSSSTPPSTFGGVNVQGNGVGNVATIINTEIDANTTFAIQATNTGNILGVANSVLNASPTAISLLDCHSPSGRDRHRYLASNVQCSQRHDPPKSRSKKLGFMDKGLIWSTGAA
jgi:hypothetical protein